MEKVYALDASEKACNELIPKNAEYFNLEKGSDNLYIIFKDIPLSNATILLFLLVRYTIQSVCFPPFVLITSSLKEGSFLLVQEPAMPDFTTNLEYQKKYDCIESKFGVEIRNGDRDDPLLRSSRIHNSGSILWNGLTLFWGFLFSPI